MRKILFLLLFVLLITPVYASHREKEECGLTNIGQCIIDGITGFFSSIFNFVLFPFVELSLGFIYVKPNISAFYGLWKVIIFIISGLYTALIVSSGLYLIIKSDDVEGRIKAKQYLKSSVIILFLVPISFYVYQAIVDFTNILTSIALNHVENSFLYVDFSGIGSALEELVMFVFYLIILLVSFLFLSVIYFFASLGVVFFPIAILLYYVPFTHNYGKFIMNLIFTTLFTPFISALILAGFSQLAHHSSFETTLAITAFATIDFLIFFLFLFAVFSGINQTINLFKGGYEWATTFHKK